MPQRTNLPAAALQAFDQGDGRLHAPSATRNAPAIAEVLHRHGPSRGCALEIASGTGQHAAYIAATLPDLTWQPSEVDPARRHSIDLWVVKTALPNLRPSIPLDATSPGWGAVYSGQDLILCANLLHLISHPEARCVVTEAARALSPGGCLAIYGPFLRGGVATSQGDCAFDTDLRARDPEIGYKNDATLQGWLEQAGLSGLRQIEMPANNLMTLSYAL